MNDQILKNLIMQMRSTLNEKQYRQYLGTLALLYGRGGTARISELSGVSQRTVWRGKKEVESGDVDPSVMRASERGRKPIDEKIPGLKEAIEELISDPSYGNSQSVISWTTLSFRKIAGLLESGHGISVCHESVGKMLSALGFRSQVRKKTDQSSKGEDIRDAQFQYINDTAEGFIGAGWPVIFVDRKQIECIGDFESGKTECRVKRGSLSELNGHFSVTDLWAASPYGGYVPDESTGFINFGIRRDTSEYMMEAIMLWWENVGRHTFPNAAKLMVVCDYAANDDIDSQRFQHQLAGFSKLTGLEIHISYLPIGTSRWNRVDHRLFFYTAQHRQGLPLINIEMLVELIGLESVTSKRQVICKAGCNEYRSGADALEGKFEEVLFRRIDALGVWNYVIRA